jgi:hypothetical protein
VSEQLAFELRSARREPLSRVARVMQLEVFALRVACPVCGAPVGDECATSTGRRMGVVHARRRRLGSYKREGR